MPDAFERRVRVATAYRNQTRENSKETERHEETSHVHACDSMRRPRRGSSVDERKRLPDLQWRDQLQPWPVTVQLWRLRRVRRWLFSGRTVLAANQRLLCR